MITRKRWTKEERAFLLNSNWKSLTPCNKVKVCKALNRSYMAIYAKYYELTREKSASLPNKLMDFSNCGSDNCLIDNRSDDKVEPNNTVLNKFIHTVLEQAKSAIIEEDKITIYFKYYGE